jgi:alanyl-tRNA synthetase
MNREALHGVEGLCSPPTFLASRQRLLGKIIQAIAPIVGGKGGGKDASKLDEALAKAKSLLG